MIEIVYQDKDIVVCIKPSGVKSTDEPGGVPELVPSPPRNCHGRSGRTSSERSIRR